MGGVLAWANETMYLVLYITNISLSIEATFTML